MTCLDGVVKSHDTGKENAILFGCGTGHDSFLLTQLFDDVLAVDYCGRFLDAAMRIQSGQSLSYGDGRTAVMPAGTKPENIKFLQVSISQKSVYNTYTYIAYIIHHYI